MLDWLYGHRHAIQLAGLVLLTAGIAVILAIGTTAGLAIVGVAALVLASVQPLILARARSRRARRLAPRNGHAPGADLDDLDRLP